MKSFRMIGLAVKVLTVCLLMLAAFGVTAAPADDVRARMKERLPLLNKLKDAGVIGENNQGYVTVRDDSAETKGVVDAENADRKVVYAAIARKNNTTPELVGQRRALKIVETGKSQQWFQDAKGNWYQKK